MSGRRRRRGVGGGHTQAVVAAAQAAQARVGLAIAGLEVGVALDAHVHLRAGHHRLHAGFGVGPGGGVFGLRLAQLGPAALAGDVEAGAEPVAARRRDGLGVRAACGHGGWQAGREGTPINAKQVLSQTSAAIAPRARPRPP